MIEILLMMSIIPLVLAAKKTPVFGQLTLTGEFAVDWVRSGTQVVAKKIEMGSANAFDQFNLPDWAKEKGVVAIIWPENEWENPLLVTQKSILRVIEARCVEWEEDGAVCEVVKRGRASICSIQFAEDMPSMSFIRAPDAKKFDPYQVEIK